MNTNSTDNILNKPDRRLCCCFTGHRNIPGNKRDELKKQIKAEILKLQISGIRAFIAGGALGFDTLCAECVCEIKRENPFLDIKLFLYLPCTDQSARWTYRDKLKYNTLKSLADSFIYVTNSAYTNECMKKRNYKMVDDSSCCIAYFSGRFGGTMQTVNYAKKNKLKIINLWSQ